MNVLSLFSGIGGLEFGLERAGMTVVGQVEINPFCRQVLAKHWPDVPRHDDVRTAVEWWLSEERPRVDVICGGFPCQDISSANVRGRKGLAGDKSGLWTSFRAVVSGLNPRWVIAENSPRWRSWMPSVRQQLSDDGYRSVGFILSAGTFSAPHKRPRGWVVADSYGDGESLRALYAKVAELRPVSRPDRRPSYPSALGGDDGLPNRMDRLAALGNAVVPQVPEFIGHHIADSVGRVAA